MKWASAISEELFLDKAVNEVTAEITEKLAKDSADLVMVFVSSNHQNRYAEVPELVLNRIKAKHLVGCSGGGVIGGGKEVEHRPGVAVTAAVLPETELFTFHVEDSELPSPDDSPRAWEDLVGVTAQSNPHFVILPDPFTIRADQFLQGLDYAFSTSIKIGGLASGGMTPGVNALFMDDQTFRSGVVGVAIQGNIHVETIVAQGCRPVGRPLVVTRCDRNALFELDGEPPMDVLRQIFEESDERDKRLINSALHLGVVMDSLVENPRPGDFLIRNIMGLHKETGALIVGELLREGQLVQFHVRDAQTAEEDLQALLDQYVSNGQRSDTGALLFSCLGRGEHLFGRPNHDTNLFYEKVSRIPLTGFFCNGEIGPVGGDTFLHGFTSSFALFRPAYNKTRKS